MLHIYAMRTTLDINDALLLEAKRIAVERRTSLTAVVEDALRMIIGSRLRDGGDAGSAWPVSTTAKPVAGVDFTRTRALLDRTDEPP
jgi:hypothetical protein